MNRPVGELLADILADLGRAPTLSARNMKNAASPDLKTAEDKWIWNCSVTVSSRTQGGITIIERKGDTPDEAVANCYRAILAADRSLWSINN